MAKSRRSFLASSVAVALAVGISVSFACKPSTKGETQAYERNKIELSELATRWSGFKAVADAKAAEVEPKWTAALEVSDEEQRAEAMKAANDGFEPLLNKLSQVKSKSEGLESTMGKLRRIRLNTSANRSRREDVLEDAQVALDGVDDAMNAAEPADEAAAVAICEEQISALISAAGPVNRMHDKYKTKVSLKGKKKGKKK
jgi:hypothetical protein